jgi:2'-5' RNA ligase
VKRLFCAVKIPLTDDIEEVFGVCRRELASESITWVGMHHLHITLKFFGDTPVDRINPIIDSLQAAAADSPPCAFRIEGLGTFGSPRQPRVIWLGVKKARQLISLQEKIQTHLIEAGYRPEQKLFTPHLTIGRIKHLRDIHVVNSLESEFKETTFARVDTTEFYLIESRLQAGGPVYTTLQTFSLGEGHRA